MNQPVGTTKRAARTCVFTIASRNYLHFARTLMASVQEHAPEADRVLCLCDRSEGIEAEELPFEILPVECLPLQNLGAYRLRYTQLELNTAVKPSVFRTLFERGGYRDIIYFDPDIRLYGPLTGVWDLLGRHDIVLTPHLTEPSDDGHQPDEHAILVSGAYNLGFLGLRRSATSEGMLRWWEGKLAENCLVDLRRGLFVDQKWIDLAPTLFEGVYICRNEGWNVAHWNLNHRRVERCSDGSHRVNGRPLLFFHFSGICPDGSVFGKYQNRYTMDSIPPCVRDLAIAYCAELRQQGADRYTGISYALGCFPDGIPIPEFLRRVYRELVDELGRDTDPMTPEGRRRLMDLANRIVPGYRYTTYASLALHASRVDLQARFPRLDGVLEYEFAQWFLHHAVDDNQVDEAFLLPVRERVYPVVAAAEQRRRWSPRQWVRAAVVRGRSALYQVAWSFRGLAYPFTTSAFRQRVNRVLMKANYRAGPPSPRRRPGADRDETDSTEPGI